MVSGIPLLLLILSSILLIIALTAKFKLHPFLALVIACFYLGFTVQMPLPTILTAIESGFSGLMAAIGLIVIFGSVIGIYLERSGGALRIAQAISNLFGQKRTLPALSLIGAVVSIPVFCDSGFILLSGLSDKLSTLSKESKASLSLALASGLYTTHTLIPPTPGPIAAAGNLGASDHLGTMILLGLAISIPVLFTTQFFARRLGKGIKTEAISVSETSQEDNTALPSLWKALLPLLLPILLIAAATTGKFLGYLPYWLSFLGTPVIAIFLGALLAMFLLKPKESGETPQWFKDAIYVAGPILIITAAGGAFGGVLKATLLATDIADWIGEGNSSDIGMLVLVFVIAAVLKTAQGSSTSAMVITSSLLAPMLPVFGWDSAIEFALAVAAIGGGAMMVSHYNDSYFWVVSQFSGMDAKATGKSFSVLTVVQGITVLSITILLWIVLT
ncbi:GntP family permease [Flavobacteriaceae bacterium M23B6Z8]